VRWGGWGPVSGFGSLGRGQGDGGGERVRSVVRLVTRVVWKGRRDWLTCLWVGREEWTKGYIVEVIAWLFVFVFLQGKLSCASCGGDERERGGERSLVSLFFSVGLGCCETAFFLGNFGCGRVFESRSLTILLPGGAR